MGRGGLHDYGEYARMGVRAVEGTNTGKEVCDVGETIVFVISIVLMLVGCGLVCMVNAGMIRNATTASVVGLAAFVLFCVAGAMFCFGGRIVDEGGSPIR